MRFLSTLSLLLVVLFSEVAMIPEVYAQTRPISTQYSGVRERRKAGVPWYDIDYMLPNEKHCGKDLYIPELIGGTRPVSVCLFSFRRYKGFGTR